MSLRKLKDKNDLDYDPRLHSHDLGIVNARIKTHVVMLGTNHSIETGTDMGGLCNTLSHVIVAAYKIIDEIDMSQKEYDNLIGAIRNIEHVPEKFIEARTNRQNIRQKQKEQGQQ